MPGDRQLVYEHLRHGVRALLHDGPAYPPAQIDTRSYADPIQNQILVRLSYDDYAAGGSRQFNMTMPYQGGVYTLPDAIAREAQTIWRQEREEHIVNHHPDVVAARERINAAVLLPDYNPTMHAHPQENHMQAERRVRNEINGANDYGWVQAQWHTGHNTGIVQMYYEDGGDMPGGFYRARAPTPPPPRYDDGVRGFNGMIPYPHPTGLGRSGHDYAKAEAKGLALLKRHLTPQQKADYETYAHFHVKGCDSGKTYRIKHGTHMNVYLVEPQKPKYHPERASSVREWLFGTQPIPAPRLPKPSEYVEKCGYCFVPAGGLCAGDCMLIQKVSLETDEKAALRVANKFPVRSYF